MRFPMETPVGLALRRDYVIRQSDDGFYWKGDAPGSTGNHIFTSFLPDAVMFGSKEAAYAFFDENFLPDETCVCIVLANGRTRAVRR